MSQVATLCEQEAGDELPAIPQQCLAFALRFLEAAGTHVRIRQHTSAHVSTRQHTSAYVAAARCLAFALRLLEAAGTQFTCFTGTKAQLLTHLMSCRRDARGVACSHSAAGWRRSDDSIRDGSHKAGALWALRRRRSQARRLAPPTYADVCWRMLTFADVC